MKGGVILDEPDAPYATSSETGKAPWKCEQRAHVNSQLTA